MKTPIPRAADLPERGLPIDRLISRLQTPHVAATRRGLLHNNDACPLFFSEIMMKLERRLGALWT
jgi:hypothetical protein